MSECNEEKRKLHEKVEKEIQRVCARYIRERNSIENRLALKDELMEVLMDNYHNSSISLKILATSENGVRVVPYFNGREIVTSEKGLTIIDAIEGAIERNSHVLWRL